MVKIGDKIRIIHLVDEPFASNYEGKEGIVTKFNKDFDGKERIGGTWGGIFIYIDEDEFEIIESGS